MPPPSGSLKCPQTNQDKLDVIQSKALTITTGCHLKAAVSQFTAETGVLPIPARDYYSHFSAALRRRWFTSWQNIVTNKLRAVKDCFSLEYLLSTESVPWSHSATTTYWTHAADAPTSSEPPLCNDYFVPLMVCLFLTECPTHMEILWIRWCP